MSRFSAISLYARTDEWPGPILSAYRSTAAPSRRRVLFVVSRDLPELYESLAYAFDGDYGVRVIFDRRRAERRRWTGPPTIERRHEDWRSGASDWQLRSVGWVQIDGAASGSRGLRWLPGRRVRQES